MAWVIIVIGVVVVLAIAAAFVGSESFRLGHETSAAIFDLDEAVEAVADGLSEGAQARLSYADVRQVIRATLDHLAERGLGALPGHDVRRGPDQAEVIVRDDDLLAVVLGEVEAAGIGVEDADAALVVRGLLRHLDEIGALGPQA